MRRFSAYGPINNTMHFYTYRDGNVYVRFASPFIPKRLFNYFSRELFKDMEKITIPFKNIDHIITEKHLNFKNLMKHYEQYLKVNAGWLLDNYDPITNVTVEIIFIETGT
ncbi:MAG: hypothetical protein HQK75_00335 [Candidatus Magnetomorum sp.]|nr:hypothetical protein [Candidatus Magnetomorum sp.]